MEGILVAGAPTPPRVLVADDDPSSAEAIRRVLEAQGYEVLIAASAADARARAEAAEPDLLIADIYMPGNEALQLLEWAPVRSGSVPAILMTGNPGVETAVRALRFAALDYLEKPVDPAYLLMRVQDALAERKRRTESAAASAEMARLAQVLTGHSAPTAWPDPAPAATRPESPAAMAQLLDALSAREREVATAFVEHRSLSAVSRALCISPNTVRGHLASIFRKLGVRSQVELVAKLMRAQ